MPAEKNSLVPVLKMIFGTGHGIRILLGWLVVAFTFFYLLLLTPQALSHAQKDYSLLIVSFDGFRWDYLNRTDTPNFDHVIKHGVYARKGLINVFTTSTLTNHWTMVTGLYPESHGIIENDMFDPVINKTYIPLYRDRYFHNDPRFYDTGAEPIWVTNQRQKPQGRSGSVQWWGAENTVKGIGPTLHMPFDLDVEYFSRIDTMVGWFTDLYPINLGLLYFSEPDHTAHRFGPDSENVTQKIKYADELTGYLIEKLRNESLLDDLNVIITSDHGFTSVSRDRLINLDDFVDPALYHMVHYTPVASIIPAAGKEDYIFERLLKASTTHSFTVYRKADIPERLHYKHNIRVTPIIAIADLGYSFISQMPKENFTLAGTHGFDNIYEEMHPFFMAFGPSFKENFKVDTFNSVDLYPLMCHLLGLDPAPNNGSMETVSQLLYDGHGNTVWTLSTYILCLVVIASVGGLFSVATFRHRRYLRRKLIKFGSSTGFSWSPKFAPSSNKDFESPLLLDEENVDEDGDEF